MAITFNRKQILSTAERMIRNDLAKIVDKEIEAVLPRIRQQIEEKILGVAFIIDEVVNDKSFSPEINIRIKYPE